MKNPTSKPSAALKIALLVAGVALVVFFILWGDAAERWGGSGLPPSSQVAMSGDVERERPRPLLSDHAGADGARTAEPLAPDRAPSAEPIRFLGEGSDGGLRCLELSVHSAGVDMSQLKSLGPRVLVGRAGRLPLIGETASLEGGIPES